MLRYVVPLAVVAATAFLVDGMPTYVAEVPNGANVPDVAALGHIDPDGGGANNQFGLDFAAADHDWTVALCQMDSDGDGQTNGQELGDPCCEWDEDDNAVVLWTEGVSHPGDSSLTSDESLWANVTCGSSTNSTNAGTNDDDDDVNDADDDDDFDGNNSTNRTSNTNAPNTFNGTNIVNDDDDADDANDDDDDDTSAASSATISTVVAATGLAVTMTLLA